MILTSANISTVADNSSETGNDSSIAESSAPAANDEDDDEDNDNTDSNVSLDAISLLSMANATTLREKAIVFNASDTSNSSSLQMPVQNSSASPSSPSAEH